MNNAKTTQQVANQIAAEIAAGYKGEFVAMIVAHVNGVNCNRASAALRRCVKMGLLEKAGKSCAGSMIYRVVVAVPTTTVSAPTFCCVAGKWEGVETSFSAFWQTLN